MEQKRMEETMTENKIVNEPVVTEALAKESVIQNVQPVQTSQSAQPTQPVQASEPTQPVQPTQSVQVSQPVQAAQPTQPVQASEPVQPTQKEVEKNLYLQYNNLEFSDKLMFEAAINDYCKKSKTAQSEIQAVNLYVKPEEGKAYYVINHDGEKIGDIDL